MRDNGLEGTELTQFHGGSPDRSVLPNGTGGALGSSHWTHAALSGAGALAAGAAFAARERRSPARTLPPEVLPAPVTAVVAGAPRGAAGVAGGLLNAARQLGTTLGVATLGAFAVGSTTALLLPVVACAVAALVLARKPSEASSHDSSSSAGKVTVNQASVPTCTSASGDKRAFS